MARTDSKELPVTNFHVVYWFNANTRDKSFDGFVAGSHRIVFVAGIDVQAESAEAAAEIAFDRFNRHGQPTPELDAAEAPSMSVGDVVAVYPQHPRGGSLGEIWMEVKGAGFARIASPYLAEDVINSLVIENQTAGEVITGDGDRRLARERAARLAEVRARFAARIGAGE